MMARRARPEAGFTLIEALVALALTGLVLSALATLTSQWFPNWNRGIDRIQRGELIGMAMQRIAADLAAAEYVPANRETKKPLFEGSALSVTFVRTALGPNAAIGLDVVRIGEATDQGHLVTLRSRTPFAPLPRGGVTATEQVRLSGAVVLLKPPLRLSFAYAGPDQVFRDSWLNADKLPAAIMLTVRDSSGAVLSASTVTPVHIDAPASGGKSDAGKSDVDSKDDNDGDRVAATVPKQGG